MKRVFASIAMAAALGMGGCDSMEVRGGYPPPRDGGPGYPEERGPYDDRGDDAYRYVDRSPLGIEPGHLPPPGECRVWFPGRPPGQQPPPGDCEELAAWVPPGAWLISRDVQDPEHVHVSHYDPHREGVVIRVRVYVFGTGEFVVEF